MRNVIVSIVIGSTLMAGSALAADLPLRGGFVETSPLPPIFTWTGFYLGASAGYATNSNNLRGTVPALDAVFTGAGALDAQTASEGATVGGQLGYTYQFGAEQGVVLGVEADLAYLDVDRNVRIALPPALGLQAAYTTSLKELGTLRGRLGYAFGPVLFYGTGGFAYGEATRRATLATGSGETIAQVNVDDLDVGYAVGGGIEYLLPIGWMVAGRGALTLRGEYLHYDLGQHGIPFVLAGQATVLHMRSQGDLGRLGVNYRF